jgi:hypothetical protein
MSAPRQNVRQKADSSGRFVGVNSSSAIQYRRELIGPSEPILHLSLSFRSENMANAITMRALEL